jgi:hypothetical protein
MFIPNDDSTPQMLEKSDGLSSVTTASDHTAVHALERHVHFVGPDVARQPHVLVDGRRREQVQVALRQPFDEALELAFVTSAAARREPSSPA